MSKLRWWTWTAEGGEWTCLLSRVLVVLTALLLMAMPITEHMCNWDRFLRGGPDVEFSVLAGLLFVAILVLSMRGAMLRPPAMRRGRMERATDPNKTMTHVLPTGCGSHPIEEFSSSGNETGSLFFDLPALVPMRI